MTIIYFKNFYLQKLNISNLCDTNMHNFFGLPLFKSAFRGAPPHFEQWLKFGSAIRGRHGNAENDNGSLGG